MRFDRRLTDPSNPVYEAVRWKTVACSVAGPDGPRVIDVEVPAHWSVAAAEALARRVLQPAVPAATRPVEDDGLPTFLQSREPDSDNLAALPAAQRQAPETSAAQVFDRVAGALGQAGWRAGYFDAAEDAEAFVDELRHTLVHQMAVPSEAVLARLGLDWAYGAAEAATSTLALDHAAGSAVTVRDGRPVVAEAVPADPVLSVDHAGFLHALADAIRLEADEAGTWAGRQLLASHAGALLSAVREGGDSDVAANPLLKRAVAAALDAGVPDGMIARLVSAAEAGLSLADLGLDGDPPPFRAEMRPAVALSTQFIDALGDDRDWPVDNGRTVAAQQVWSRIATAVWLGAVDGVRHDNDPDALVGPRATLNLLAFRTAGGGIDSAALAHVAGLWTVALDLLHLAGGYPSAQAAEAAWQNRPIALGMTNLAGLLAACGLSYADASGRHTAAALTATITGGALSVSRQLGQLAGGRPGTDDRVSALADAIDRMPEEDDSPVAAAAIAAARATWSDAFKRLSGTDLRNAQLTAIEPTGLAALLLDADAPGVEPLAGPVRFARTEGDGFRRTIDRVVPAGLRALGYDQATIDAAIDHAVGRGTLAGAPALSHGALMALGFTQADIDAIEGALADAGDLRFVFNRWTLGEATLTERLGVSAPDLTDPAFDLLDHLGIDEASIAAANAHVFGAGSLAGAPGIDPAHAALFDGGADSASHLAMAAAVQPFLTAPLDKAISVEAAATPEAIATLLHRAFASGLSRVRVTREGAGIDAPLPDGLAAAADDLDTLAGEAIPAAEAEPANTVIERVVEKVVARDRAHREKLPDRRKGYTQKAIVGGHKVYLRTGEYDDGRLGELFIDMHKEGAAFRSLMNNFAIAVSIGLQYGVPLEEYVEAFTFTRFEPAGAVSGNNAIRRATSLLDYIFRELAISYLGRQDLASVDQADLLPDALGSGTAQSDLPDPAAKRLEQVASRGFIRGNLKVLDGGRAAADEALLSAAGAGEAGTESAMGEALASTQQGMVGRPANSGFQTPEYEGDPCPECHNLTLLRKGRLLRCQTCGHIAEMAR